MSLKTNATTSGTMVLLLGMLFSSQSLSNGITLNCNGPDRSIIGGTPITWPHIAQKAELTPSFWINAEQVRQWTEQDSLIWIDVRSAVKKKASSLNNALDISLQSIKDKSFLHSERIILVGDGFDQPELDLTCRQLREAGFENVYVLQGGADAKRQLENPSFNRRPLFTDITPEELLSGGRATSWTLIAWDLHPDDIRKLPEQPTEQWFSAEGNLSLLTQRILSHSQIMKGKNEQAGIVIVTANNNANQQLKSLLQQHGATTPTLWLQGGMQAYKNHVEQQHNIRTNTGLSLKRSCISTAL